MANRTPTYSVRLTETELRLILDSVHPWPSDDLVISVRGKCAEAHRTLAASREKKLLRKQFSEEGLNLKRSGLRVKLQRIVKKERLSYSRSQDDIDIRCPAGSHLASTGSIGLYEPFENKRTEIEALKSALLDLSFGLEPCDDDCGHLEV